MDLETENRIAAILMKEAAELRQQAEKDGVHAYLSRPNVRGRPNSRFLTATVLGVQQANRAVEVNEMWRIRQKEQELDDRLKGRRRDESSSDRSYREQELDDKLKRRQIDESSTDRSYREQELDDRLKRRQRDESSTDRSYGETNLDDKLKRRRRDENSSDRSYRDTENLWRNTDKSHADGERKTSDYYSSSERIMQEYRLNEEEGLRDDEVENFLNSRVKRGRGTVGSRMDETGPYLPPCPDSMGNQLTIPDVAAREEWEHHANPHLERPSRLKSLNYSEDKSFEDKHKKKKKVSSSKHNRKHKSKEKSNDKNRNRKEERRHK